MMVIMMMTIITIMVVAAAVSLGAWCWLKIIGIRYRKAVLATSPEKSCPCIFVSCSGQKCWFYEVGTQVISIGQGSLAV